MICERKEKFSLNVFVAFRPDLSCVWKLLGDCMTIIHPLDGSKVSIIVPISLLSKDNDVSSDSKAITKFQVCVLL